MLVLLSLLVTERYISPAYNNGFGVPIQLPPGGACINAHILYSHSVW